MLFPDISMAPEFQKAAESLSPLIPFYNVDCDEAENKALCGAEDIKGFPTVKVSTIPRSDTTLANISLYGLTKRSEICNDSRRPTVNRVKDAGGRSNGRGRLDLSSNGLPSRSPLERSRSSDRLPRLRLGDQLCVHQTRLDGRTRASLAD
jgi:hypothetical protein